MEAGPRQLGDARLQIGVCKALPPDMRKQTRELSALEVPTASRGKGHATSLVYDVCAEADEHNMTLVLFAQPFGDIDLSRLQLVEWYAKRFGFVVIQAKPTLMARMPGSTPRTLTPIAKAVQC